MVRTMNVSNVITIARKLSRPYRITDGKRFRLDDIDSGDSGGLQGEDKPQAKEALHVGVDAMAELQDKLYAQDRCYSCQNSSAE